MLVGLDTNAVSLMARGDLPELRSRLLAAVDAGRVRVPVTEPLVIELCGNAPNEAHFRDVMGLLRSLSRGLVMRPADDRIEGEAILGHRLPRCDAFFDSPVTDEAFATLDDREAAISVWGEFKSKTTAHAAQERKIPTNLGPVFGVDKCHAKEILARLFTCPRTAVANWVEDRLRETCDRLALRVPRRASPELSPTIWFQISYHLGRVRLLHLSQKVSRPSDLGDRAHAGEAAYVDRFVTDDGDFHKIVDWAPLPRGRFVRTDQLLAELEG